MAPALLVTTIPSNYYHKPSVTLTPPLTPPDDKLPTPFRDWHDIAEAKQTHRESILAEHSNWRLDTLPSDDLKDVRDLCFSKLTPRENDIVHLDATALVKRIRLRHYTSVEVTVAFCKVATLAQDLTNCLTEIFFQEAIYRATELDHYLETTGQVIGPLHGLPVSIKDHVLIKDKVD
jgi:amidase